MSNLMSHPGILSIIREMTPSQIEEYYPKLIDSKLDAPTIYQIYVDTGENIDQFMIKILDREYIDSRRPQRLEPTLSESDAEKAFRHAKATMNSTNRSEVFELGVLLGLWSWPVLKRSRLLISFDSTRGAIIAERNRIADELEWYWSIAKPLGITEDEILARIPE